MLRTRSGNPAYLRSALILSALYYDRDTFDATGHWIRVAHIGEGRERVELQLQIPKVRWSISVSVSDCRCLAFTRPNDIMSLVLMSKFSNLDYVDT